MIVGTNFGISKILTFWVFPDATASSVEFIGVRRPEKHPVSSNSVIVHPSGWTWKCTAARLTPLYSIAVQQKASPNSQHGCLCIGWATATEDHAMFVLLLPAKSRKVKLQWARDHPTGWLEKPLISSSVIKHTDGMILPSRCCGRNPWIHPALGFYLPSTFCCLQQKQFWNPMNNLGRS